MSADAIHLVGIIIQTLIFLAGLGATLVRTDIITKALSKKVENMEKKLEDLTTVIRDQAVQAERLNNQSQRMTMLEQRVEDLRRGRGYVQNHGQQSVDGEY